MTPDGGLSAHVTGDGVFVRFATADGREFYTNAIDLAEQISERSMAQTVLQWCRERINETPAPRLTTDTKAELLARIDSVLAGVGPSVYEAAAQFGNVQTINHECLDERERKAREASALPADQFLELIAVARNGLGPRAVGS